jgi:hypothetical protein
MPRLTSRPFLLVLLILPCLPTMGVAQSVIGPAPSVLWAAAPADPPAGGSTSQAVSRAHGFEIGAVVGVLAAGFLGHQLCRTYGEMGDCRDTALWWGAIGGILGGLIGASAGADDEGTASHMAPGATGQW